MQQEYLDKENYTPDAKMVTKGLPTKTQTDQKLFSDEETDDMLLFNKRMQQKKNRYRKPFQIKLIACQME